VLLSAAGVAVAFCLDSSVREGFVATHVKGWKTTGVYAFNATVSKYGDWPQLVLTGALAFLLAWKLRNRDWMKILAAAVIASTLAGIIANTSRGLTGRTRPGEGKEIEQGWYGLRHEGKWLVGDPRYNAFPSGHTATAVGFAGVLLFARPAIGTVAVLVAFGIAWSRMYLGRHNFSDVVVSSILALVVAWFTWNAIRDHGERWLDVIKKRFRKPA
jgi:membrane-associated phospholipid phosphatase